MEKSQYSWDIFKISIRIKKSITFIHFKILDHEKNNFNCSSNVVHFRICPGKTKEAGCCAGKDKKECSVKDKKACADTHHKDCGMKTKTAENTPKTTDKKAVKVKKA
ncbi:hypothetical protein ACP3T3_08335 [Chryseobacterium sp. CBSDS_008]|uniref:hypothetical protein n=1 Tax=Chryseobacterium sp. CBSDS_008 TaxID=3415265 RepID=UPI003CF0BC98